MAKVVVELHFSKPTNQVLALEEASPLENCPLVMS